MDINDKMLNDLAGRMGLSGKSGSSVKRAEGMAEKYKGKGEDELLAEIMELKKNIKKDPVAYQKQLQAIRALSGMMNKEQRARLDKVMRMLESDD